MGGRTHKMVGSLKYVSTNPLPEDPCMKRSFDAAEITLRCVA